MSVKPILFNTDMVRAILESRKTVTRRVVKPQPVCYGPNLTFKPHKDDFFLSAEKGWLRCRTCGHDPEYSQEGSDIAHHWKPPYQLGDFLYVRETWCDRWLSDGFLTGAYRYGYKADGIPSYGSWGNDSQCKMEVWIPSIHMPKEAARIWLKVTNVRVERLQDITTDQIIAEGVKTEEPFSLNGAEKRYAFSQLWDSTIKKENINRYSWEGNPWVWVIEFERCGKPQEVEQ